MTDLQVMVLAVSSESACIDSENLLFSKLQTDFKTKPSVLIGLILPEESNLSRLTLYTSRTMSPTP